MLRACIFNSNIFHKIVFVTLSRGRGFKTSTSLLGAKRSLEDNSPSFEALIQADIDKFNGMIFRKGGRPLIGYLKTNLL